MKTYTADEVIEMLKKISDRISKLDHLHVGERTFEMGLWRAQCVLQDARSKLRWEEINEANNKPA